MTTAKEMNDLAASIRRDREGVKTLRYLRHVGKGYTVGTIYASETECMSEVRLGSIPHADYDLYAEEQGLHEDTMVRIGDTCDGR